MYFLSRFILTVSALKEIIEDFVSFEKDYTLSIFNLLRFQETS